MSPLSLAGYLAERKEGGRKRREREKEKGYSDSGLSEIGMNSLQRKLVSTQSQYLVCYMTSGTTSLQALPLSVPCSEVPL